MRTDLLEEIIMNGRILAKFMLGQTKKLSFKVKPLDVRKKDTLRTRELILGKSHRELGMNKSALWHIKRRLGQTGSARMYNETSRQLSQRRAEGQYRGIESRERKPATTHVHLYRNFDLLGESRTGVCLCASPTLIFRFPLRGNGT